MASPTTVLSQYHHFIPRFILRNFAHPFKPPDDRPRGSAKRRRKNGYYLGEPMLHAINLAKATAECTETPVSRTFGLTDMYRDFADAINQHYLEEHLSRLESRAGGIVNKIRKAFEAGEREVWITRPDRDILRKFLFIMKYRGSTAHKRFYHLSAEGYSESDRERLLKYMHEKGFQKPVDVWFDNIKGMLDLKMDPKGEWRAELVKRIYPDDANLFIANTQMMYLALCTPSGQDDEFLLTENAYSIYEGPVSSLVDPNTGESTLMSYTEFHTFAVISPKLMIVLRSFLLPIPEEDSNEDVRRWRETMFKLNADQHNDPQGAKSSLEDLPINKARNSYTKLVNGRIVLLDGEDGSPRSYHKYCFQFFPISTDHVLKINCIMLEQSYSISMIVFKTRLAARKTLEHYLSMPCGRGNTVSYKIVGDAPDDPRLLCLRKLEQAASQLGSNTKAIYVVQRTKLDEEAQFEILGQMLAEALPKEPTESMRLYMKLGGNGTTMPKDMDQAAKMLNMRIKIDVWTQGLAENIRVKTRENLQDLFCQLPARRVWYYLKHIRLMQLGENEMDGITGLQLESDHLMEGPEDVIVNVSHLIRTDNLCRLMYFATLHHIHLVQNPGFSLEGQITLDEAGARRLLQIKALAFGSLGSICDCAISAVEEKARLYRSMAQVTGFHKDFKYPFWTEEESMEMAIRVLVRGEFSNLIGDSLSSEDLGALKGVLFGILYPSLGNN